MGRARASSRNGSTNATTPTATARRGSRSAIRVLADHCSDKGDRGRRRRVGRVLEPRHEGDGPSDDQRERYPLRWNPEEWIESVLVHPGADFSFRASVNAVVEAFA